MTYTTSSTALMEADRADAPGLASWRMSCVLPRFWRKVSSTAGRPLTPDSWARAGELLLSCQRA